MENQNGEAESKPFRVETICRDCVFAKYEDNTQIDCDFHHRLFKFEENGATLVGQDDGVKRYFKFDRYCSACHNVASLQQIPKRKWLTYVEDRVGIQVDYIIQVSGENSSVGQVLRTFNSVKEQNPRPIQIIINFPANSNNSIILDLVEVLKDSKSVWRVEQLPLNKILKLCKGIHYVLLQNNDEIPSNFAEVINKTITFDTQRLIALLPDEISPALFVQRKGVESLEKILENGVSHEFVKHWKDLNG